MATDASGAATPAPPSRKRVIGMTIGIIVFFIFVVLLAFGANEMHKAMIAEAPATNVKLERVTRAAANQQVETVNEVSYSFQVNGKTYSATQDASWYREGMPVKVCYSPKDPKSNSVQKADAKCGA